MDNLDKNLQKALKQVERQKRAYAQGYNKEYNPVIESENVSHWKKVLLKTLSVIFTALMAGTRDKTDKKYYMDINGKCPGDKNYIWPGSF